MIVDIEGTYCINDSAITDGILIPFSTSWSFTTLAECCYENFLYDFKKCMGHSSSEDLELPPCSPPPELSGSWYVERKFDGSDDTCVRECDVGDSCNGRAFNQPLFATFEDCCNNHLWYLENSPCSGCKETFWDSYFSISPPPETGFYPICKTSITPVCFGLIEKHHFLTFL